MIEKNILFVLSAIILIMALTLVIYEIYFDRRNNKFMTLYELLEFNLKLFLIMNAGLLGLKKIGLPILGLLTNDEVLIKFHRRMNKKYGDYVSTYVITNARNYYILCPKLVKKILTLIHLLSLVIQTEKLKKAT